MGESLGLGRATRIAIAVLAVALIATIAYVAWDMSSDSTSSVLDYEAEQFEEYLANNPSNSQAWLELANLSLQQGKYDKAISEYEESLALNEEQPAVLMGLGLAYMRKGQTDEAGDYLNEAVYYLNEAVVMARDKEVLQPGASLPTMHYYLAKVYMEMGDLEMAAEEVDAALWYNRVNADAILLQGMVFAAQGDDEAAEANYMRALALVPNYTEVYIQLGALYEARGEELMATYYGAMADLFSGSVAEAIEQINVVINSLPPTADAFWGLGWGYEKLNMLEEAIASYEQAVGIDPDHGLAGGALRRLGVGMYLE